MADPGTLAAPGVPLLQIDSTGPLQLQATVDESMMATVRKGMKLNCDRRAAYSMSEAHGTVAEIVPAADPSSHSFLVKIDLAAFKGSARRHVWHRRVRDRDAASGLGAAFGDRDARFTCHVPTSSMRRNRAASLSDSRRARMAIGSKSCRESQAAKSSLTIPPIAIWPASASRSSHEQKRLQADLASPAAWRRPFSTPS